MCWGDESSSLHMPCHRDTHVCEIIQGFVNLKCMQEVARFELTRIVVCKVITGECAHRRVCVCPVHIQAQMHATGCTAALLTLAFACMLAAWAAIMYRAQRARRNLTATHGVCFGCDGTVPRVCNECVLLAT
jgi:hypothetical protein